MNYRTITDLHRAVTAGLAQQARDADLVVGIPRSGLLAANILALHVNRPLVDLDGYLAGRQLVPGVSRASTVKFATQNGQRRVLVVDDSVCQGTEMRRAKDRVAQAGFDDQVYFAAVFVDPGAQAHVDFWCEVCRQPRFFEWNLFHHLWLDRACVDIDGVLCDDPEEGIDDDGEIYSEFLVNATPKFVPTVKIANLVTCRLEKYRTLTEQWLDTQGIEFDALHMMQYKTAVERRIAACHAAYKAEVFRKTNSSLFIESSLRQAQEIAYLSGKPVICVETNSVVEPPLGAWLKTTMQDTPRSLGTRIFNRLRRLTKR